MCPPLTIIVHRVVRKENQSTQVMNCGWMKESSVVLVTDRILVVPTLPV